MESLVAVVGSRGLIEERIAGYAELLIENGSATGNSRHRCASAAACLRATPRKSSRKKSIR